MNTKLIAVAVVAICLSASLRADTITFSTGAKFDGVLVGFTGDTVAVLRSARDGKECSVNLTNLSPASARQLVAVLHAKPWMSDSGWLACERTVWSLGKKMDSAARLASAMRSAGEKGAAEAGRQANDLGAKIGECIGRQRQIESRCLLRKVVNEEKEKR